MIQKSRILVIILPALRCTYLSCVNDIHFFSVFSILHSRSQFKSSTSVASCEYPPPPASPQPNLHLPLVIGMAMLSYMESSSNFLSGQVFHREPLVTKRSQSNFRRYEIDNQNNLHILFIKVTSVSNL